MFGGLALAGCLLAAQGCSQDAPLAPWHREALTEGFTAGMADDEVRNLKDYLDLEERLFQQLDDLVVEKTPTGPDYALVRFSRGSAADPNRWPRNWNRTFQLEAETPVGGVLLLHGMSDSPYSLRAVSYTHLTLPTTPY